MKNKTLVVILCISLLVSLILIGGCSKKPETQRESAKKASNSPPAFPENEKGSGGEIIPTGKVTVLPGGSQE